MRLLLTHPHAWPRVRRGAERELHELASRLADRGHVVSIVTGRETGVMARHRVLGVPVTEVRVPGGRRLDRRGWHHEARFGAVAAVATAVSRADLVHHLLYADAAFAGRFPAVHRGRPLVLKLTGTILPELVARRPVDERLLRGALERATSVWCNSAYARDAMAGFDVPMEVVPAGVDSAAFSPGGPRSDHPLVVCTSAPDEPRKRVEDLVAAWPEVLGAVPGARLELLGHATTATRERLLAGLPDGVVDTVTVTGTVGRDTLLDRYRAAWVVVQPSVHEALGLSVLEALACGTPVVGADSGATPELVGEDATFAPLDPVDCARAVTATLAAPPDDRAVTSARRRATRYDWGVVVDDVERRHHRLLEDA